MTEMPRGKKASYILGEFFAKMAGSKLFMFPLRHPVPLQSFKQI
jgi:hypothetical protein